MADNELAFCEKGWDYMPVDIKWKPLSNLELVTFIFAACEFLGEKTASL